MIKILPIGKSGRLHCMVDALSNSSRAKKLYTLSEVYNPGLVEKSEEVEKVPRIDDVETVRRYARKVKPDFAIIGPEEPLCTGVVDMLTDELGIPCVGPTKALAQLECSKSFTRELLSKYSIPGNPEYKIFRNLDGLESYLRRRGEFVVKPDGLTGGKGVKVYGEHLHSIEEAVQYCKSLFETNPKVVIEEKLDGEEFSFQSFCDGRHVVDTLAVQDHKRAFDGDNGPNTGGMGSYSCEDHSLPFLSKNHIREASRINSAVAEALWNESRKGNKSGKGFKGILYGGFIVTRHGLRLLEYNARFGDPEVMNVLPLLKTDFIDVCEAIINGTLDKISIIFEKKATVCKYVVPRGYPTNPEKGEPIITTNLPRPSDKLKMYYAAVNIKPEGLCLTGSRALAFVGIGDNLSEAEQIAEDAASRVGGPVRHRKDIGTSGLIQRRIDHMRKIMKGEKTSHLDSTRAVANLIR